MNYNFQFEQSLTKKVVAQLGYVGSEGRHLLSILDINQAALSATGDGARPYDGGFTDGVGNPSTVSSTRSKASEPQTTTRSRPRCAFPTCMGSTAQAAYTWSHSNDEVTAYRGALPQDSTNFKGDYGPSDFDDRNIFTGLITYDVPGAHVMPALTKGWEINSLMTFHGGTPFSVYSSADTSGTNDGNQRANLVPGVNPVRGLPQGRQWMRTGSIQLRLSMRPPERGVRPAETSSSDPATATSISRSSRTPRLANALPPSFAWRCSISSIRPTMRRRLEARSSTHLHLRQRAATLHYDRQLQRRTRHRRRRTLQHAVRAQVDLLGLIGAVAFQREIKSRRLE